MKGGREWGKAGKGEEERQKRGEVKERGEERRGERRGEVKGRRGEERRRF